MSLFELDPPRPPREPILVSAFSGWVDAAGVGTDAAELIAAGAPVIARFDGEVLFDYRSHRPTLEITDGVMVEMEWPELVVRLIDIGGRDVLVLHGPEPDHAWRAFGEAVQDLGRALGIRASVCLGAIPAAVPHTRPVRVLATASDPALLEQADRSPAGTLRVPAAAVNLVERGFARGGIPSVGFWAQVPHYVGGPFSAGVIALIERTSRHLGLSIPLGTLPDQARAQRRQLDEAVAERPEAAAYLDQLEQISEGENVASGDEIAAEIERFLRGSPGEGRGTLGE